MLRHSSAKLSNGTRVIFVPHRDTAAVTVLAMYEVGSRYETLAMSGASHFIEHMMFKGTTRRPATMDISRDLDSVGADYNAFTSKDFTCYYVKLQSGRLPLAVDMIEDMVYHSLYREKDVAAERKVIHEEIRMYEDNPSMLVEELMEEELFRGSALGRRISGTVETMNGISRDDLAGFRDRYYAPSRTVIAVAGKFDEAAALDLLEEKFGKKEAKGRPTPYARARPAAGRGPAVRVERRETEQAQVAIGFPSFAYGDQRLAALSLLCIALGGTMSSRLFMAVREKRGLAYSVHASHQPFQDVGCLTIGAGLAKDRVHDAVGVIMREVRKIREKDVTKEELYRSREYLKGKMILGLEESSNLADWFGKQELLTKRVETPDEKLEKIFAVTTADVRKVAVEVFRPERLAMAVIGPYTDGSEFAKHAQQLEN